MEIKSFIGTSAIVDFHTALGQFLNYRMALDVQEPTRKLFLAVPADAYKSFFSLRFAQAAIRIHSLKLIVYDAEAEAIVQWIN